MLMVEVEGMRLRGKRDRSVSGRGAILSFGIGNNGWRRQVP